MSPKIFGTLKTLKKPSKGDFYVGCHIGHINHDRLSILAQNVYIQIYDYKKYLGKSDEYCTGQDIISECIGEQGVWETLETDLINDILDLGDRNDIVLDFGSHIGYYSLLAANKGYMVASMDASAENLELLETSMILNGFKEKISRNLCWIDDTAPVLSAEHETVHLLKCDTEGNEKHVLRMANPLFKAQKVNYAIFEISPVFNDSYPDLVEEIARCGYKVYQIPASGSALLSEVIKHNELKAEGRREYVASLHQENFLFVKEQ